MLRNSDAKLSIVHSYTFLHDYAPAPAPAPVHRALATREWIAVKMCGRVQ